MKVTITIPTARALLGQWKWALLALGVLAFGLLGGGNTARAAEQATTARSRSPATGTATERSTA